MDLGTCRPGAVVLALLLFTPLDAWAVGGNSCATATVIGSLPYVDTGNTCGFTNWYDEHCAVHSASSEVVYEYSPATDQCVDIILCHAFTDFDTKLYVYDSTSGGCPGLASDNTGLQIACDDDACPAGSLASTIEDLPMLAGTTYWIVVDGTGDDCGNYNMTMIAVPPRSCSALPCNTDVDCDDGVPCTLDLCNMGTCANVPDDLACDDSLYCNGVETCDVILGCQSGGPIDCSHLSGPCSSGICDEALDQCRKQPMNQGLPCNDGDICTTNELCHAGFCAGSFVLNCCVVDADCDDSNPCTNDFCQEPAQTCGHSPAAMGLPCGSPTDSECTNRDTCDGAGTCQTNDEEDGTACSGPAVCTIGICDAPVLDFTALPEDGYIASEPRDGFVEDLFLYVVGRVISEGMDLPAVWTCDTTGFNCVIDILDFGADRGVAEAVTCDGSGTCVIVGEKDDPPQPAAWVNDGGGWVEEAIPPTPNSTGGSFGQIHACVGAFTAVGSSTDPGGFRKAAYWERDEFGEWVGSGLPDFFVPGRESEATFVTVCPEDAPITLCEAGARVFGGWGEDGQGIARPLIWRETGSGTGVFGVVIDIPFPDGVQTDVAGDVIWPDNILGELSLGLTGTVHLTDGTSRGILWSTMDLQSWSSNTMPPLPGYSNSTVNGFMDDGGLVLTNTVLFGTSHNGDPLIDGVATMWEFADVSAQVEKILDVNDLADPPAGCRLVGVDDVTAMINFSCNTHTVANITATYICPDRTESRGTPLLHAVVLTVKPSFVDIDKNRYVSFRSSSASPVAYKLDMVSSLFHPTATVSGWVGVPDANGIASLEANPVTRTWTESIVSITGCDITPVAEFELRASTDGGLTFSPAVSLQTAPQPGGGKFWGDTVGSFNGTEWSPPQGVNNIDDAVGVIKTWQGAAGAPQMPRTDVEPQEPNRVVNFNDVLFVLLAFQGDPYPFGCPADPCQDNVANPCP